MGAPGEALKEADNAYVAYHGTYYAYYAYHYAPKEALKSNVLISQCISKYTV